MLFDLVACVWIHLKYRFYYFFLQTIRKMKTLLILNVFHILTWSEGGDYLVQIKTEFSHQPHQYHEPIMTSKSGDSPREKWKDEDAEDM